jgi:cellulose/xylan binding protein with CBM9 domain/carbohydrate binding protein with CBM4/9 domain
MKLVKSSVLLLVLLGCSYASIINGQEHNKLTAPPVLFKEQKSVKNIQVKPDFLPDGIVFGKKSLVMDKKGNWTINAGNSALLKDSYYLSIKGVGGFGVNARRTVYDKKFNYRSGEQKFTYSCKFPVGVKGNAGAFTRTVKLVADNLLQVDIKSTIPKTTKVNYQHMTMEIPFTACAGKTVSVNDQTIKFSSSASPKPDKNKKLFDSKIDNLLFTPETVSSTFNMKFLTRNSASIQENRTKGARNAACVIIRIHPDKQGKISFLLDLRSNSTSAMEKSADTHAGIDFWRNDRLHVPNYAYSRNLIRNPSFEAGLRYYTLHETWGDTLPQSKSPIYSTTDQVAKFGNHSLEILAVKGRNNPGYLQTFTIPVETGKKYKLSFYAKGECRGLRLKLLSVTAKWLQFPKLGSYAIPTDKWQRYTVTFVAPNSAFTMLLRGTYDGSASTGTGRIWLDGLQLEAGDKATAWRNSSPVQAKLVTADPDNFLTSEQPVNAWLKLTAAPRTSGTVDCSVVDYFYKTIWKSSFTFKTDDLGIATVDLPINSKIKNGIYVLGCKFKLKNGKSATDYFRITRMKPVPEQYKNQDLISLCMQYRMSRKEDHWQRLNIIGIKSFYGLDIAREEKLYSTLTQKYKFKHYSAPMLHHGKIGETKFDFKNMGQVTPEIERRVEEACFQKAKKYSWIKVWLFSDEPEAGGGSKFKTLKDGNIDGFAKLLLACRRGVKRFDPKKLVLMDGACNMSQGNGIRWVDRWLGAVNKLAPQERFDGTTIHPYRTRPDDPDLDDDAQAYFKMLARHGYDKTPVYWNGGIYHTPYNVAEWGLTPYRGCSMDHWRAGAFSYDMGWAERISAAYFARSWLVGLKYQDKVKHFNGWLSRISIDAYLTPLALQKIPNTLANLFGNATFKHDIRFAPQCRAYIFEDEQQRPVAAIWSHIPKVDRGSAASPVAEIKFSDNLPEFIDLMGNQQFPSVNPNGSVTVPITPFPLFIRGKASTLNTLIKSIAGAKLINSTSSPLTLFAKPVSTGKVEVTMTNLVSRKIKVNGIIKVQGKAFKQKLSLQPRQKVTNSFPLTNLLAYNQINIVRIMAEMTLDDVDDTVKTDGSFSGFAIKKLKGKITIDGNIDDWRHIPAITIKNRCLKKQKFKNSKVEATGFKGDLDATFRVTWDNDKLYLLIEVKDDKLVHLPRKSTSVRYNNDSVQIYIDTFGDGRLKSTRGFDGNDYEYDLFPNLKDDSLTIYRRIAPEQQIAGGLLAPQPQTIATQVKGAFKRTTGGYIYEVAFPKTVLAPMQFKSGTSVGFSLFVNDVDQQQWKGSLTLTPPGTGGHMNPHLYPVMLLTD